MLLLFWAWLFVFGFTSLTLQLNAQDVESGVSLRLATTRASELSNIEYELQLELVEQGAIDSEVVVSFDLIRDAKIVVLDFNAPSEKLKSFQVNGVANQPRIRNGHILFSGSLFQEGRNRIEIEFEAGEQSLNRNADFLYTLLVPDRASTVFPCFDQPDLKARFSLRLGMPKSWIASANGAVVSEREVDAQRWVTYQKTKPISTYLFSFVAGEFQRVERKIFGRQVVMLHRESDEQKVERNLDDIFAIHEMSLKWMEQYTGIPYPFEKFDFVLIPSFQIWRDGAYWKYFLQRGSIVS